MYFQHHSCPSSSPLGLTSSCTSFVLHYCPPRDLFANLVNTSNRTWLSRGESLERVKVRGEENDVTGFKMKTHQQQDCFVLFFVHSSSPTARSLGCKVINSFLPGVSLLTRSDFRYRPLSD